MLPPRRWQEEDVERAWRQPAWAVFAEMRTGKTARAIYEMSRLATEDHLTRFLVVCPLRVLGVWREMIPQFSDIEWTILDTPKKWATLARPATPPDQQRRPVIVLINYDQVWARRRALLDWRPEYVVADEAHRIKNRGAKRSRAMHALGAVAMYRRALTGTPDPNGWADYYSIYKFLDPTIFGKWQSFVDQYCLTDYWGGVVGYKNVEDLATRIHKFACRIRRADVWELPAVEDQIVKVPFPSTAERIYRQLARSMYAELQTEPQTTISVALVVTKLLRLAQLTGGFVQPDNEPHPVLIHEAKLNAAMSVIEEVLADVGAKVVVYVRFLAELAALEARLRRRRIEVTTLHGGTKREEDVLRAFRGPARVLIAQIASGSLGIDLSCAETAVFYSVDFDAGSYRQARDRIWRPDGRLTYIHLVCPNTIDQTILDVVNGKIARSELVLDRWQELVGL